MTFRKLTKLLKKNTKKKSFQTYTEKNRFLKFKVGLKKMAMFDFDETLPQDR